MRYHVKRVGQALFTLFVVVTLSFVMFRLMPGGPIQRLRIMLTQQLVQQGGSVDPGRINRMIEIYSNIDPSKPLYIEYFDYMRGIILYQDFGKSIWQNEPVFDILFAAMPWSVFISVYGLALGFISNVLLGAFMAYKEGSLFDNSFTGLSVFLTSVPYYVGAIALLAVLAFNLHWFPTGGRVAKGTTAGLNAPYMIGIVQHAALPILSQFIVGFGGGALAMRGNSIRLLESDTIRVARLRGLRSGRIASRYVARNAVLPMYTGLMIGISSVFSSSVILERIFSYPGVGWYTFGALQSRDYPLLMGSFIFFTAITIAGILIADLTYGFIDPRVTVGGEDHESY